MTLAKNKRREQAQADRLMVEHLIENGQFNLSDRLDHKVIENVARHHLCWTVGRLNKTIDNMVKEDDRR